MFCDRFRSSLFRCLVWHGLTDYFRIGSKPNSLTDLLSRLINFLKPFRKYCKLQQRRQLQMSLPTGSRVWNKLSPTMMIMSRMNSIECRNIIPIKPLP
jgi:hypothetical protein